MTAVAVTGLSKRYATRAASVEALRDVSFRVPEGALGCVVGPSGSGKSTLLAIVGGLDVATAGEVYVGACAVHRLTSAQRVRFRATRVGFVFQSCNLIAVLSAAENVALPLALLRLTRAERRRCVDALVDELGLRQVAGHRPGELSGGQQQRVAIARALVTRPLLVLADEPTAHLDAGTGRDVIDVLGAVGRSHRTTVLVATHDAAVECRAEARITLRDGADGASGRC